MAGSPGECAGWAVCDGWGGCRWYEDESVSALREWSSENHFEIPFFQLRAFWATPPAHGYITLVLLLLSCPTITVEYAVAQLTGCTMR